MSSSLAVDVGADGELGEGLEVSCRVPVVLLDVMLFSVGDGVLAPRDMPGGRLEAFVISGGGVGAAVGGGLCAAQMVSRAA